MPVRTVNGMANGSNCGLIGFNLARPRIEPMSAN